MSFVIEEEVNQNSSLYEAFFNKYFSGWTEEFQNYKSEMKNVSNIIDRVEKRTNGYYPSKDTIFKCFENTPLDKVKVVIWTDQPYSIQRSYSNLRKELKNEYPENKIHTDHNIFELSKQGVLFMNTCMCYSDKDSKSYHNLWFRFTNIVIEILNNRVENCIHLLWGKNSQKLSDTIKSREVYMANDPTSFMFFGNNHFIKTNITLDRQGKKQIDWFQTSVN